MGSESESIRTSVLSQCSFWIKKVLTAHFEEFFGDPKYLPIRIHMNKSQQRRNVTLRTRLDIDEHFYKIVVDKTK